MADEARKNRNAGESFYAVDSTVAPYEVRQGPTGLAEVYSGSTAALSGQSVVFNNSIGDRFTVQKTSGITFLKGGRVYWDYSANLAHFKKVNDRDFYMGRAAQDADATAPTVDVILNVDPPYDIDLARDSFTTAIVKTAGTPLLNRRGGAHDVVLDSTNEAQKVDALSLDGIAASLANAIIEFAFCVPSDGAGTVVDVSVGIASATHATDADSIAQHLLMHLDANNTNINFQSKDGTTTVAATDSTTDYTEGQTNTVRKEVWFDCRNPADVQIYVDAVLVLDATTFNVSAAAATWFLLLHVEKSAAADTYEFLLEWLRARFAEQ